MSVRSFFSIIIPTQNASGTLKGCLDSLAAQTFSNFEVVVIDSKSADDTIDIAKSYQPALNLRYISEKDKGIYDAMNKGVALACGEYLYFMGSDDTLFNENVLATVSAELTRKPERVIYGNVIMRSSDKEQGLVHAGVFDLRRLLSHNICHQSLFYHHSVFKTMGNYNLQYPVLADYDFNLRCAAIFEFRYIDIIVANFYPGGASTQLTDSAFDRDKNTNIIKYFLHKIHTRPFVNLRLVVQRAAFSRYVKINWVTRLYCMLVYAKLKTQSLF